MKNLLILLLLLTATEAQAQRWRVVPRSQPTVRYRTVQPTQHTQQKEPIPGITDEGIKEVIRLGDHVQEIGTGHQNTPASIFAMIAAPPPDDSHKWYITVIISPNCKYCTRLLADWETDPNLRAFADTKDYEESWSHFNVFRSDDTTQQWRWKNIKIESYPTIIVQPPLNRSYGDPATVVLQETGYNGDAKALAGKIREGIKYYISTINGGYRAADEATDETITQSSLPPAAAGRDPPFVLPTAPLAPLEPLRPPQPQSQPQPDDQTGLASDLLGLVKSIVTFVSLIITLFTILSSGAWTNVLLLLIVIACFAILKRLKQPIQPIQPIQPTQSQSQPSKKIILK